MTLALLLACATDPQDTAAEPVLTDAELTSLSSWTYDRSVTLALPGAQDGEPRSVTGDRVVVFLPLDESALPELELELDLGPEASEAESKAQDWNSSRSNKTSALDGHGDGGEVELFEALELSFEDGEPCAGTWEACVTDALPAIASLSPGAELRDFQVVFGGTTEAKAAAGGPVRIAKRVDQSSPQLIWAPGGGGSPLSGEAMARLMVYQGDQLAGIGGPYVDWGELEEVLDGVAHSSPPNGVSGALVDGGMLLSLEWGDQPADAAFWEQAAADWEALSPEESAGMEARSATGATLGDELKNIEVVALGLTPTREDDIELQVALTHQGLDWPVAVKVSADDELGVALDDTYCGPEGCITRAPVAAYHCCRKRPGRVKFSDITLEYGVPVGGSEGEVSLAQGSERLTITTSGSQSTFSLEGDGEVCSVWIWETQKSTPWEAQLSCGQEYSLGQAELPVGVELLDDDGGLHSALIF